MRIIRILFRSTIGLVLVVSVVLNLALTFVNFVLQPIWKAAAVATAVATTKTAAEASEKAAVAKTKVREKAKGRLRRLTVAVPVAGVAAAAAFEYNDFSDWQEENPEGTVDQYIQETVETTKLVIDEVLAELPAWLSIDRDELIGQMETVFAQMRSLVGD
ncbi:hypothetical protein OEW28_09310 [Defluviimonas sp. WL0002]|uniref:Uncharacterized protein n=1 Tax=Albidovulum marisflavi TaxID=2984159 RepID=A0ABT2ZCI3_9RHOB|nr:hypothetical protein [Defluviimonas sp. WL0002]MCV2868824.1 hypothetical protein [Defluviimonas sp. WL0002]